jgi:hypothetical protein
MFGLVLLPIAHPMPRAAVVRTSGCCRAISDGLGAEEGIGKVDGSLAPAVSPVLRGWAARTALIGRALDLDPADHVDQAVGHDRVAVMVNGHVPHDVSAARNGPALERQGDWIEAHHGIWLGA